MSQLAEAEKVTESVDFGPAITGTAVAPLPVPSVIVIVGGDVYPLPAVVTGIETIAPEESTGVPSTQPDPPPPETEAEGAV